MDTKLPNQPISILQNQKLCNLCKMTLPVTVVLSPVLTLCPGSLEFHGRQTGDTNESMPSSPTP